MTGASLNPRTAIEGEVVHALLAAHARNSDGRWFSARDSGLWISDDTGATWQRPKATGSDQPVTALARSPQFTHDRTVFAGAYGSVLRSWDAGNHWRASLLPPPPPLITSIAVSPAFAEDGVVLAGTLEDGIFRSADRGESWKRWIFGLLDLSVYALAISPTFADDDTVVAATETGVFQSMNGGRSWRESPLPETASPVLSIALSPRYGETGVVWAGSERAGIWRSRDRGHSWHRVDQERVRDAVNGIFVSTGSNGHDTVTVNLSDAVVRFDDAHQTWTTLATGVADGGGIAAIFPIATPSRDDLYVLALRDGSIQLVGNEPGEGRGDGIRREEPIVSKSGPTR